jgi:L-amino acid N-acyltransferase YncA
MRQATHEDFHFVARMVHEFNHAYYDVPLSNSRLEAWYSLHMQTGVIFITKAGFISALLVPDPVREYDIMLETGWYSDDGQGAKLLLKLIRYAKEQGANEVRASTLDTSPPEAEALLSRLGFEMHKERGHRLQL